MNTPHDSAQTTNNNPDEKLVENTGFHVSGTVRIIDADSGEVLIHQRIDE